MDTDKEGNALDLSEIIGADDEEMLEQLDRKLEASRLRRLVDEVLDSRSRRIICARYGLGGRPPQTQREVAAATGLSRSYVSRIEKAALQRLRAALQAPPARN